MYSLLKKILFQLDAEQAHNVVCFLIRFLGRFPSVLKFISGSYDTERPANILGMVFRNPIGLAAGFDKDAKLVLPFSDLGFGFVEVGTVTLKPQVGNKRPRLFRIPEEKTLFNRMGFNSEGAGKVADRLKKARAKLPQNFPSRCEHSQKQRYAQYPCR